MKLVKLQCPSCGANLSNDIPEDMKYIFCLYCGQKMMVDDEVQRSEYRYVKEDVAELKRIESEKEVELRRLEIQEKDDKRSDRTIVGLLIFSMAMLVAMPLYFFISSAWESNQAAKKEQQGMISAGSYQDYEGKDVNAVIGILLDKGFNNISSYDLNDAGLFWNRNDTVDTITIDGNSTFYSKDYFEPNAKISITYH